MAVPFKKGECYVSRNGLHKVLVTGYYRRWQTSGKPVGSPDEQNGALVSSLDKITSGPHQMAITVNEWETEGFTAFDPNAKVPGAKAHPAKVTTALNAMLKDKTAAMKEKLGRGAKK